MKKELKIRIVWVDRKDNTKRGVYSRIWHDLEDKEMLKDEVCFLNDTQPDKLYTIEYKLFSYDGDGASDTEFDVGESNIQSDSDDDFNDGSR